MVRGALSDDPMLQLKVVTGTLNSQKYQDQNLKSGVRPPLDSLDGQNMVLWVDKLQDITLLVSSRNTKSIEHRYSSTAELVAGLEPYRTHVGQAWLTCLKPETSRIKTIVNFARLCRSGTGFHVLNACIQ